MMQYYSFHIGDYTTSAAHLTLEEDAIYRRLLDLYYKEELPLSLDIKALCRRIRVTDHETTTQIILDEFFIKQDDGWHNPRADEELAKVAKVSAKRSKAAQARWQKQPDANAMQVHSKCNASGMLPNTHNPIPKIECNLKPLLIGIQRRYGKTPDMNGYRAAITEAVKDGFNPSNVAPALDWIGNQKEWEYIPAFQTPNKLRDNLPAFYAKSQEGIDHEEENRKAAARSLADAAKKAMTPRPDAASLEEGLRILGGKHV
jgi:uncharacterized protein YdaU (DUF1376 family)